jgi:hypothetical protein
MTMNVSEIRGFRTFLLGASAALMLSGCLMNESAEVAAPTPPGGNNTNGAPVISGVPPRVIKVGVPYAFTPQASDPDADTLTFSVTNRPIWLTFESRTGALTGTPLLGSEGSYNDIRITVSDGAMSTDLPPFSITVEPATAPNMPPEISGTPANAVTVNNSYAFSPTVSDPDGDVLTFSIQNMPGWAAFNDQTGALTGTPAAGDEGTYQNIAITVSDSIVSASLPAFSITVNPANAMPTISGTPQASVIAGNAYSFTPTATDPNGDTLTFSVQNPPAWASFDPASGQLSGTPQMNDVGAYPGIIVSVSDGTFSASLPAFTINVTAANSAPQISGTPATAVNVGQTYAFTPTASDADGDTLVFSIQNQPAWAQFDAATGALTGVPQAGNVGTYSGIVITVDDGMETAVLPAFSITVSQVAMGTATLSWTAPTQNTDGSPLNNLAGYRIHYGNSPGNYTNTEAVNNAGITSFVVTGLSAGTWYFVSTTINTDGVESAYSNVAQKIIN